MKKFLLLMLFISTSLFSKEITVSIVPQKYFVEKITGDKFNVNVMVKPGFSPAVYEPKPSQMRTIAKSSVYFSIGVPFESVWLEKFKNANKNLLVVDTSKGIEKIEMAAHEHHGEEGHDGHDGHDDHKKHDDHKDHGHDEHEEHKEEGHDDHEGHDHSGLDPHIWLDPILVKQQAKNIYDTLVKLDAKNTVYYKTNYEAFLKELDELDHELHEILEPYEHKEFMVFHPSWGYFSKRYHLEQISIEIQGKEPKPAQLVELVKEAKLHNIKIVFVAPQFSQKGAKTISKNINGNVATIDPLESDWKNGLLKTAKEIAKSYK
jgi:zinc transport system substrate-binding protein